MRIPTVWPCRERTNRSVGELDSVVVGSHKLRHVE